MSGVGEASTTLSRRPYLLRAMHEWMGDAGLTPHIIVDAGRADVEVPNAYVKDGKIVLNVSLNATQRLQLLNQSIEFDARFDMSDALDLDPDDVADLEPRLSRAKCRHPAGRPGRDDVARLKRECGRQVFDQGGAIEDQVARI